MLKGLAEWPVIGRCPERNKVVNRVVKLLLSLAYFCLQWAWRAFVRLSRGAVRGTCVALYYHGIPAHTGFAQQMETLVRLAQAIPADFNRRLEDGVRYAIVTFCDGYQCFVENALSELVKRNIPATVFIPTGYIGRRPDWGCDNEGESLCRRSVLTSAQIQALPASLISVGSHGVTHKNLNLVTEDEAREELLRSKRDLERITSRDVNLVYVPYGVCNSSHLGMARAMGYKRVFCNSPRMALRKKDEFVCGSVWADPTDWPLEFKLKILGAYSWLPFAIQLKRSLWSLLASRP